MIFLHLDGINRNLYTNRLAQATHVLIVLVEGNIPAWRIQAGIDADLVVFDLATVQDRSTYDRSNQTSVGMRHVFVVRDGELEVKAFQGKPVRRTKLAKEIQSGKTHEDFKEGK